MFNYPIFGGMELDQIIWNYFPSLPAVYDESISYLEFLGNVLKNMNEERKHVNNMGEAISLFQKYVLEELKNYDDKIVASVVELLNNYIADGTIADLINKVLLQEINEKIDTKWKVSIVNEVNEKEENVLYFVKEGDLYSIQTKDIALPIKVLADNVFMGDNNIVAIINNITSLLSTLENKVDNNKTLNDEVIETINNNLNLISNNINELKDNLGKNTTNYVYIQNYGAKGDGVTDDTQALKSAMEVAKVFRGTVYIPPTEKGYLIAGTEIEIPVGVKLEGATPRYQGIWGDSHSGSVLLITGNEGIEIKDGYGKGSTFLLSEGASIESLSFIYPNQTLTYPPKKYPFLIKSIGYRDMYVKNVYCKNPYQFIDFSNFHERCVLENLYFDCFKTGILIDHSLDVDRLSNLHCWLFSVVEEQVNQESLTNIMKYKLKYASAFVIGQADNIQCNNLFVWGVRNGLLLGTEYEVEDGKEYYGCYGQITNFSADGCLNGILCNTISGQGLSIVNYHCGNPKDDFSKYTSEPMLPLVLNNTYGVLNIRDFYSWGGEQFLIKIGETYGTNVTNTTAPSFTKLTNIVAVDNVEESLVKCLGSKGKVIIEDLYTTDNNKYLIDSDIEGCDVIFLNPIIKTKWCKNIKYPIKDYYSTCTTVNASSSITIENKQTVFVSGNTPITNIIGSHTKGDRVLILFNEACNVVNGNNIVLKSEFTSVPNGSLELVYNGEKYIEVNR